MSNVAFCLMGPTASGKTALAIELVKQYPVEIISVDSAMIYTGMNVGTAKPSAKELQQVPHHLLDICNPMQSYSAAQFCEDALNLSAQIRKKGKIPLFVGGTMMYFNALQKGLSELPKACPLVRAKLENECLTKGLNALHERLAEVDAASAARIHAHDTQRILRALEVYELSGKTLSSFLGEKKATSDLHWVNLILFPENRNWLHERIAQRFDVMLADGFIEEVRLLQSTWPIQLDWPSMRCVGYRQALQYLNGEMDDTQFREKAIAATRQLAKRQLTWLRHWDDAYYFDPEKPAFREQVVAKIKEILDNSANDI